MLPLAQWKKEFFVPIQQDKNKLVDALLHFIERQRNGEAIDQSLVEVAFVSLGLDSTDPNKECLDVYKEHFELPLIEATEKYYKKHRSFMGEFPIVIASVDYHIGSFSFLAPPVTNPETEDFDLNAGFYDQIEALCRVQRYIKSFGGDLNE
ncbi:ubiquitin ligase (cullin) of SCF [Marasmius tenuissimus]|nr:ubiquitin ligase (cullin) of SCF [Marasmius tenuissimus]